MCLERTAALLALSASIRQAVPRRFATTPHALIYRWTRSSRSPTQWSSGRTRNRRATASRLLLQEVARKDTRCAPGARGLGRANALAEGGWSGDSTLAYEALGRQRQEPQLLSESSHAHNPIEAEVGSPRANQTPTDARWQKKQPSSGFCSSTIPTLSTPSRKPLTRFCSCPKEEWVCVGHACLRVRRETRCVRAAKATQEQCEPSAVRTFRDLERLARIRWPDFNPPEEASCTQSW